MCCFYGLEGGFRALDGEEVIASNGDNVTVPVV